jgi:hypothetical protein
MKELAVSHEGRDELIRACLRLESQKVNRLGPSVVIELLHQFHELTEALCAVLKVGVFL